MNEHIYVFRKMGLAASATSVMTSLTLQDFSYRKLPSTQTQLLHCSAIQLFHTAILFFAVPKDSLVQAVGKTEEVEKWDLFPFHIRAGWPEAVFKGIMHISSVW